MGVSSLPLRQRSLKSLNYFRNRPRHPGSRPGFSGGLVRTPAASRPSFAASRSGNSPEPPKTEFRPMRGGRSDPYGGSTSFKSFGVKMRSTFALFCLSILVPLLTTSVQAHDPGAASATSSSIPAGARDAAAVVEAFHRSLKNGNPSVAPALLDGSALIYESGGVERSKAEYAGHHLTADAEFSKSTTQTVKSQSGEAIDDVAWIATESRTSSIYKGRAIDISSTEPMVLRRFGKIWKIVHIHWSSGK